MPSFSFYAGDFLTDVQEMTDQEVGAYMRLLCYQWINGSIPSDPDRITKLISTKKGEFFRKIWPSLEHNFEEIEGKRLINSKLEETRAKAIKYLATQEKHGKEGAAKRWGTLSKPHKPTPSKPHKGLDSSSSSSSLSSSSKKEKEIPLHPLQTFIIDEFPRVSQLKTQLTFKEAETLTAMFSKKLIKDKLDAMENKKDLLTKYMSVHRTLNNWCKKDSGKPSAEGSAQDIQARNLGGLHVPNPDNQ